MFNDPLSGTFSVLETTGELMVFKLSYFVNYAVHFDDTVT